LTIGITQMELAERLDVTQEWMSRMERNLRVNLPHAEEFRELAAALETTPEDLMMALGYIDRPASETDLEGPAVFTSMLRQLDAADLPQNLKDIMTEAIAYVRKRIELACN
jgi:transcriptional regulator with XRE-family HTH domain